MSCFIINDILSRKMKKVKTQQPIGVFDSGVGGLSILKELHRLLPNENYIFMADQANVPYGEKSKKELEKLTIEICNFLIKKGVKLIVVACNTATCYAINRLREKFPISIVGTVPAVKPAFAKTKTNTVAVIATPATSESTTLKDLIDKYSNGVEVINIGCPGLEDTVEKGDFDSMATDQLILKYLSAVKRSKADHIVLGCTHYPFLKNKIRKILGPRITILDSGKAIARRTREVLTAKDILSNTKKTGKTSYFTNGDTAIFSKVATKLMKHRVTAQKAVW